MSSQGPFGSLDMGDMFTILKIRKGIARNDYSYPGWYQHPSDTKAHEWMDKTSFPTLSSSETTESFKTRTY